MSLANRGRVVSVIALLAFAGTIVLTTLGKVQSDNPELDPTYGTVIEGLVVGVFALVGVVLLLRRPESFIGWLLILVVVGSFSNAYATYGLVANPGSLPGASFAAVMDIATWLPFVYTVFLLLLSFPGGRPGTPRWRFIAKVGGVTVVAFFLFDLLTIERADPPLDGEANPLFIAELEPYLAYTSLLVAPLMLSVPVAAVDFFLRFRRSKGDERHQFRWLGFAAGLILAYFPVYILLGEVNEDLAYTLFNVTLMGLPAAIGIAVLKYRLYEIDQLITRTLTYGLLTASLAALYFGLVVGLQAALSSLSGGSDLAIALTTLAVAALFLPARGRIQAVVDRRFNRRAYDAARTIDAFSSRLREEIDLDTLRYEVLAVVDETMQPMSASLWLRPERAGQ